MANLYRNAYISKPKTGIWSDGSNASAILNNEFFGSSAVSYEITIDAGSYAYSGTSIDLTSQRQLPIDVGSYAYTGTNIDFARGYGFNFDAGTYAYTGTDIDPTRQLALSFDSGNYDYTGTDVDLTAQYGFEFDSGNYTYTGNDIDFVYTTPPILSAGQKVKTIFVSNFVLK